MIGRKTPSEYLTVGELLDLIERGPHLDPEDAVQFEKDLAEIRRSAGPADCKWDEDEPETPK